MYWQRYNPNPDGRLVGDCTVRAIGKMLDLSWEDAYLKLCMCGFEMRDMPSSNAVWGELLRQHGYFRSTIPNTCPRCYTIADFCQEHRLGKYLLATGTHVVAVEDGYYYDAWDSGNEIPVYYWSKEEDHA